MSKRRFPLSLGANVTVAVCLWPLLSPSTAAAQTNQLSTPSPCLKEQDLGCVMWGLSSIVDTTGLDALQTDSQTTVTYDVCLLTPPYVIGYLYDDGTQVLSDYVQNPLCLGGLTPTADLPFSYPSSPPLPLPGEYVITSYHCLNDGCPSGLNCDGATGLGGTVYGWTQAWVYADVPAVSSISPTYDVVGATGKQIVFTGSNLVDPFTCQATPGAASGINLTYSSGGCGGTTVALNYSINLNAPVGNQSLTLTDRFGTSNGIAFTVYDPQPTISSISPSTWQAGQTPSTFTITGTGFGTKPTVTFSDPTIGCAVAWSVTDNGTTATLTCPTFFVPLASGGGVSVKVISNGYGGSGTPAPPPGQTLSATTTLTVIPAPALPAILYFGQTIPATGQNVYVGQLISLTTDAGPSLSELGPSYFWSFPPNSAGTTGTVIASLSTPLTTPASTSGEVATALSPANQTSPAISFYWINIGNSSPATYAVQLQYCVNGTTPSSSSPQCSTPSTATFNVAAPTGASLSTYTGLVGPFPIGGSSYLGLYSPGLDGIELTAHSSGVDAKGANVAGAGSYQWVQLDNSIVSQYIDSSPRLHACTWFSDPNALNGACGVPNEPSCPPELDGGYPYGSVTGEAVVFTSPGGVTNEEAVDNPNWKLDAAWGEQAEWFNATMYLEWIPPAAGACTASGASACTVPVPLGNVNWFWAGDAVNTLVLIPLSNGTIWTPESNGTDWFEEPCAFCSQGQNVNNPQYPIAFEAASPSGTNNYSYVMWTYPVPYPARCQFVY